MPYRVRIDKQSCLSSGRCVATAPEAFGLDADHLGDVLPAAAELRRKALVAIARNCPGLAISLFDESGEEIDPG